MAAILAGNNFKCNFINENDRIPIRISFKFVPKSPIEVIMGAMASQIASLTIVYSTVYSGADQRKHQSSLSLAFVWGIDRLPVNSPHKWPVTLESFHLMTSSWLFTLYFFLNKPSITFTYGTPIKAHGGIRLISLFGRRLMLVKSLLQYQLSGQLRLVNCLACSDS